MPTARAALARDSMLPPPRVSFPIAVNHFGTDGHPRIDDIAILAIEAAANRCAEAGHAGLHVSGDVEVDQAVGGADLDFRIVVAGSRSSSGSRLCCVPMVTMLRTVSSRTSRSESDSIGVRSADRG